MFKYFVSKSPYLERIKMKWNGIVLEAQHPPWV